MLSRAYCVMGAAWLFVAACTGPGAMSILQSPSLDTPKDTTLADSEISDAGQRLDSYLASFDVTTLWLPIAANGALVNWQTGSATGNGAAGDDCLAQEGATDTFCSSFVSAVTYWGSHGGHDLFAQGSLAFLRPFNGPATDIALPAGVAYPQNGCAWRDYLSNYQHDWLVGTLQPQQALPYAGDSSHNWDYWTRDPNRGDPAAPISNSDWVAVLDGNALNAQNPAVSDAAGDTDGLVVGEQTLVVAQRLANLGHLVIASFRATDAGTPGHLAVVRVSNKSLAELQADGPAVISAGAQNAMSTTVREAFDVHSCDDGVHPAACGTTGIGAWESMAGNTPQITFFFHTI